MVKDLLVIIDVVLAMSTKTLTQVLQPRSFRIVCKYSFRLSHSHSHKKFSSLYPQCLSCGANLCKSTDLVALPLCCRTCSTKDRVSFNFPEPVSILADYFKFFRFRILIVLKVFAFATALSQSIVIYLK